ncbi:uncharacterized protein LOC136081653 isoform X2 [Hydra vulgaris]|uniref:Uncharacterized protein LOC136081653 isoform X2 n=1 Tax=Hydra vulgaris TaxID=6087 RepID=A0ABM4C1B1_HYDVU
MKQHSAPSQAICHTHEKACKKLVIAQETLGDEEHQHKVAKKGAVLRNPPTSTVSEGDFQKEVVHFLRGAPDRNGVKQARAIISFKKRNGASNIDNDDEPQ